MPALKVSDIAAERLAALDAGTAQSSHLTECLAVDFARLAGAAFPGLGRDVLDRVAAWRTLGISRRMAEMGRLLDHALPEDAKAAVALHPSDTVRGWACFMVAARPGLDVAGRLAALRPLADDPHFGVREWVWMAVRPHLAAELDRAVDLLAPWTAEPSERLRRFASEALRPRGVWCAHIRALRQDPSPGLRLLEPLRADPSRYVQDSVANWLNDAAKDHPDWVRQVCGRWADESPGPETRHIVKRATRSLRR